MTISQPGIKSNIFYCHTGLVLMNAIATQLVREDANLVMEDVEQRALASTPVNPSFWKRFVDDVIPKMRSMFYCNT